MDKILLIDGNSILNRAYYGIPLLQNEKGQYTNGVYGFLNMLFRFLEEEKPQMLVVAFDLKGKNFRHDMYKEYKGTRKGMPEELREQLPALKKILEAMGIMIIEKKGYEADDVLGTLAKISEVDGLNTVIISGDRDLLQLATKKTKIRIPRTRKGKTEVEDYYEKDVIEKIGVTPTEFIDIKGLMGDVSDNIPGVPGIGEKTALKIILEYKSIEKALENIEDVKPKKAKENLLEYRDVAVMSKELATIITDVPLEYNKEETIIKDIFNEEAFKKIQELQLKSLYKKFGTEAMGKEVEIEIEAIDNPFELEDLLENVLEEKIVAYNLGIVDENLVGITFSYNDEKAYIATVDDYITEDELINTFKKFFESDVEKIVEDKKRDKKYLRKFGVKLKNVKFDVSLGAYLHKPTKQAYDLSDIGLDYLEENIESLEMLVGKGKKKISFEEVEVAKKEKYLGLLSNVLWRSYEIILNALKEKELYDLYIDVEMPLEEILLDVETEGITIDKEQLKNQGEKIKSRLDELSEEIYMYAGEEFNINSPSQLGVILFEKLELKGGKKTKTGFSTSIDVLEKIRKAHPIVESAMEYRTLSKLLSTYVQGLLKEIKDDNKIHCTFTQKITATGRLSSIEPNLQNIPIRTEIGRSIRKAFIPKNKDYVFVSSDYSQIELRILAHLSEDETLIKAYEKGEDIHTLTASQVFNKKYGEVTSEERSNAKAVNFGIVYGISSFSLSKDLYITKKEADRYIESYFKTYPKIKIYLDKCIEDAKKNGYAKTLFNRRRNIPEITSTNFIKRGFGERIAMNMPIQGTAADIMKIAMIKVYNKLKEEKIDSKIILQIHDELVIESKLEDVEKVKSILKEEMGKAVKLKVDLEISMSVSDNWYDAK